MSYPSKYAKFIKIVEIGNSKFKWYHLAKNLNDVSKIDHQNALTCLEKHSEIFKNSNELGFVMLHRCGEIYLLLICTWRNENEIWETVYHNSNGEYQLVERNDPHLPTFCVWEMGITYHEAKSWKKFLGTERDFIAEEIYLGNVFDGEV